MTTPHKHAALIKSWAAGAEIQWWDPGLCEWRDSHTPTWNPQWAYRIKHDPKPDVIQQVRLRGFTRGIIVLPCSNQPNLSLTFDGETGALKHAEVLTDDSR